MKTINILIIILVVSIAFVACKKDESLNGTESYPSDDKQKLMRVNTPIPDDLSLFAIPDECETSEDYDGDFVVTQEEYSIEYDDENYTAVIYLEMDENGLVNTVAFSTDVKTAYELEEDFILTEEDFAVEFAAAVNAGGSGPILDCLRILFVGTPKYGPCQPDPMNGRNAWLEHWLVGYVNGSERFVCCSCSYWD